MASIESDSEELSWVGNVSLNLATGHDVKGLHVPDDVFGEIFIQCLPPSRFVVPSRSTAPLSVASLWQSLAINASAGALLRGMADFCSTWLSRAGGFPLSLSLRASSMVATSWLITYIRELSPLLREVYLQLGAVRQILSFPPAKYPLLETVLIDTPQDGILISFLDAPLLRQVSLSKYTAHIHLRRRELTSFRCDSIDVLLMLGFFREAKELVHGRFTLGFRWGTELPRTVYWLPRLRSLVLEADGVRDFRQDHLIHIMMEALVRLKTPALEDFTLIFPLRNLRHPQDETVSRPFTTFVGQTLFQLHTLTLSFMPVSTSTLILCLRATPSVAHLKLRPINETDLRVFFNKLVDSPHLLPQLESLHLTNESGARNPTPESLVEVLSWRWRASGIDVVQLRSFRMALANSIQNSGMIANIESQSRFKELKEEGMKLYLGTVDIL
ncbi:hypothetical protein R3P38DRAFT_2904793 [Favolaschia claudopus]|uniref:F-box domain-containing protein n=1 Tax=Favolaschia claudopus TaxID=2862362 RepID=A0AAW0CGK9_9AGAR